MEHPCNTNFAETNMNIECVIYQLMKIITSLHLEGAFIGNDELLPRTIPGEPGNLEFTFEVGRVGPIEP